MGAELGVLETDLITYIFVNKNDRPKKPVSLGRAAGIKYT